jgi:hypothetical protein
LPDDDGEGMRRFPKIGCGRRRGTTDFIATPNTPAASVLVAVAAKKGAFDITKHCSTCRNRNFQNINHYTADIQGALTTYCQQPCNFKGCTVQNELLITGQHTDPSTKTAYLSSINFWAKAGLPAFLYESYKLTVPLCYLHHISEDRSINSHYAAAADALKCHGHTPEAFQQLFTTLSGFERNGKKLQRPRQTAMNLLTVGGQHTRQFVGSIEASIDPTHQSRRDA